MGNHIKIFYFLHLPPFCLQGHRVLDSFVFEYNIIAKAGNKGQTLTDETKKKLSVAIKDKFKNDEKFKERTLIRLSKFLSW